LLAGGVPVLTVFQGKNAWDLCTLVVLQACTWAAVSATAAAVAVAAVPVD